MFSTAMASSLATMANVGVTNSRTVALHHAPGYAPLCTGLLKIGMKSYNQSAKFLIVAIWGQKSKDTCVFEVIELKSEARCNLQGHLEVTMASEASKMAVMSKSIQLFLWFHLQIMSDQIPSPRVEVETFYFF